MGRPLNLMCALIGFFASAPTYRGRDIYLRSQALRGNSKQAR